MKRSVNLSRQRKPVTGKQLSKVLEAIGVSKDDVAELRKKYEQLGSECRHTRVDGYTECCLDCGKYIYE